MRTMLNKFSVTVPLLLLLLLVMLLISRANAKIKANETEPPPWEVNVPTAGGVYLTSIQYELYRKSLTFIKDTSCQRDLNKTLTALMNDEQWAIAMYDASVHESIGIESGIQYHFGHYDQCLQPLSPLSAVLTKYCLVDVYMDGVNISTGLRLNRPASPFVVHWGVCIPASCFASDLTAHLQHIFQRHQISVHDDMCQLRNPELNISNGMLYYAVIIIIFVCLALFCTAYHAYKLKYYERENGSNSSKKFSSTYRILDKALLTFSIIENTQKLFQAGKDQLGLNSINGIKSLAMLIILAGHMLAFRCGSPAYNMEFINEKFKSPLFAFLSNSVLFVDLFLLLSGFLFCRILLLELERYRGKINVLVLYVARYIRLTPAYMAVIGFYMTWLPTVDNGPLWPQRIEREQTRCLSSWWLNILYINNYVNVDKLCMFQSWYLSVDSQLFVLAALIIHLLHKSPKYGVNLVASLAIITSITPIIITYTYNLDPTIMIYPSEVEDLSSNNYFKVAYIKTHMRASSYVFGLLTGYVVHRIQTAKYYIYLLYKTFSYITCPESYDFESKCTEMPNWLVSICWILALLGGTGSMFSVSLFYTRSFNKWEAIVYAGLHKLGWNLAVSWLILVVTTGHSKSLQKFLSNRFFAPISRLTYCAYLSNGLVELYHSSSLRNPPHLSYINLIDDIFSHIVHTFLLALILCLLFESPIHALERIFLRRQDGKEQMNHSAKQDKTNQSPSTSEEVVA